MIRGSPVTASTIASETMREWTEQAYGVNILEPLVFCSMTA